MMERIGGSGTALVVEDRIGKVPRPRKMTSSALEAFDGVDEGLRIAICAMA